MKNKKGFTLIELLVVVLIISILAAIAVPKYQKAVYKSKYNTMKNLVESIAQAQQVYFLANGKYATTLDELDITMPPGSSSDTKTHRYYKDYWCCIEGQDKVYCMNTGIKMQYRKYLSGERECMVMYTTDKSDFRNKICQEETGQTESAGIADKTWNLVKYLYK